MFHDTRLAGVGRITKREAFPPALRGVLPTSGCSRRTIHSRSRLPRGEPRRHSALAEDPREPRRDRFHRRSVKTAGFPDLEHLRPMSTLLGVFLRADGFATTARHRIDLLPERDESHPASPLATPREVSLSRCFARTDDAHRPSAIRLIPTRGHDRVDRSTPAIGNALGHPRPRSFRFYGNVRSVRASEIRDCSRTSSGSSTPERGRSALGGPLPSCEIPVHLLSRCPGWRRGRRTPCCLGAPRPSFHAPSRKGTLPHGSRCFPSSGIGYARRDCSHSVAPTGLPLGPLPHREVERCGDERTGAHCGRALAFTLTGGGEIPARRPDREDDVRPLRGPTKRP